MNDLIDEISGNMVERYSARYREMGYNVRTLGWGSEEQQKYRFLQTLSMGVELSGQSILDIGCGFGDYYSFLGENNIDITSYIGIDINQDLINEANSRYHDDPCCEFSVINIATEKTSEPVSDVGVMLGLLNLNLNGVIDNYQYSFSMIENALSYVEKALIVDFISSYRDKSYEQEDFIFYHDPVKVFERALTISPNVALKHDYMPIPQKEFMLVIYK